MHGTVVAVNRGGLLRRRRSLVNSAACIRAVQEHLVVGDKLLLAGHAVLGEALPLVIVPDLGVVLSVASPELLGIGWSVSSGHGWSLVLCRRGSNSLSYVCCR